MGKVNQLYQDEMMERYAEVARDYGLHEDDDCDKIIDVFLEKYPQYGPEVCNSCGVNPADYESKICVGCDAYRDHQQ